MKQLLLIRHGNAPASGDGDLARELDELGKEQANLSASYIQEHYNVDYAIVSPTKRTNQTFEILQDSIKLSEDEFEKIPQIYNNNVEDIAYSISSIHANPDTLLVVGHNPGLLEFALYADKDNGAKFEKDLKLGLKPAEVIVLSLPDLESWESSLDNRCEIIDIFIPKAN